MASTLTDIGLEAGCSPSTVSRVLNNSGPVNDEVRSRVQDAVFQRGYIHSASKRSGNPQNLKGCAAVILLYRPGPIEILAQGADGVQVMAPEAVSGERGVISFLQQLSNGFFHLVFKGYSRRIQPMGCANQSVNLLEFGCCCGVAAHER